MSAIATVLQPEELESLRLLTRTPTRKRVPAEHAERLVVCGFATKRGSALTITTRGHAKLAYEITRSSWFAVPV
jgi:hypothetical protein